MARALSQELIVPKGEGRAFEVNRGQFMRIIAVEGKQVGDLTLLSARDYREKLNIPVTCSRNGRSLFRAEVLYSGPPHFNAMLTVVEDKHGLHWLHGRCTSFMYKTRLGIENHRNCHDNIVEALQPYGIEPHEVPFDTFNVFMIADIDSNGYYTFRPPLVEKGGFVEFRAEMDLLVALSACPEEDEVNDYVAKPLKVEVRDS